ncbi:Strongly-conserved Zn-finger binding protein (TFIIIA) [Mycoblastus sanguinarius]|nr:Strongly-conserved Zn-finger binding protein (TFIIIA) [Mycoblastus sanguinarius]
MNLLPGYDSAVEVPICGSKRKAKSTQGPSAKRARSTEISVSQGMIDGALVFFPLLPGFLGDGFSEHEDSDSSDNTDEDYPIESSAPTPLTPISPRASPRHPSDIFKIHACPYTGCNKAFNRPAKLAQHLPSHTNTRLFVCPHAPCTKDFLRESHLKHHVKSAHSDIRDYICNWEGCGKAFITGTRLKRHHAAHEGRENFRCTVLGCGQTFRKHGTLQKHMTILHGEKKPFLCELLNTDGTACGEGFDTEGKLRSHAGKVHETNRFSCTMCTSKEKGTTGNRRQSEEETAFRTYAELQAHLASEHPPRCADCGLKFKSQRELKNHVEVLHGGLDLDERRTHICREPGCGRGFTKKGNLNAHVQASHAGKRFVCGDFDLKTLDNIGGWDGSDPCGEASTTKANFERHIRTLHSGLNSSRELKTRNKTGPSSEAPVPQTQGSIMIRLTGSGYDTESGRSIPCLITGCNHRFLREYDLEIHLQSRHGLADLEIQGLLMERDDFHDRPTLQAHSRFANEQDLDAERALDVQFGSDVYMDDTNESLEAGALRGGDFWLGGRSYQRENNGDDRLRDEMEMQHLIDGHREGCFSVEKCGQDVDMLDPAFR